MAANARGTMADQRMVDGAIPTKREREQPDEDKFEYVLEKDMVKRFKGNYGGDPAANSDILQRYGPLMSRQDAEGSAIPTKREREQPDEENFEYIVEMDMVKRFKRNYWGDPAANPDILQRYGPLMSRMDAEDNEAQRLLREIREWRARGCPDDDEAT